jgi:hypothetical protein
MELSEEALRRMKENPGEPGRQGMKRVRAFGTISAIRIYLRKNSGRTFGGIGE